MIVVTLGGQRGGKCRGTLCLISSLAARGNTMLAPLLTTALLFLTCSGYQAPLPQQDLPSTQDVGQELRELIFLSPEQRFNLVENQRKKRFFWDWPKKERVGKIVIDVCAFLSVHFYTHHTLVVYDVKPDISRGIFTMDQHHFNLRAKTTF